MSERVPRERPTDKLLQLTAKYKYALLVAAAGILLLLLPSPQQEQTMVHSSQTETEELLSVETLEYKLENTLSQIEGAGRVQVMLTVQGGMRRVVAQDSVQEQGEGEIHRQVQTVVISEGSGRERTVLLQQIYPQFQGALVVSSGGADPEVRLKLTEAVAALTGLGTDKISICKGK